MNLIEIISIARIANATAVNTTAIFGMYKSLKRFNTNLRNNGYQFHVGINKLKPGEKFADDERILCSSPGFHFASRSWCALNYSNRLLEAKVRIPENAKINEPWATNGKASADMIEIIQVFDVKTGKDVTKQYIKK